MYVALVFHWRRDTYVLKYVCIRSWKPFLCHWDLHTHLYQWLLSVLSLFNVWSSCEGWWIWMSYSWDYTLIQITYIHTCVTCYSHFMLCTVLITQSNHLWLQFLRKWWEGVPCECTCCKCVRLHHSTAVSPWVLGVCGVKLGLEIVKWLYCYVPQGYIESAMCIIALSIECTHSLTYWCLLWTHQVCSLRTQLKDSLLPKSSSIRKCGCVWVWVWCVHAWVCACFVHACGCDVCSCPRTCAQPESYVQQDLLRTYVRTYSHLHYPRILRM